MTEDKVIYFDKKKKKIIINTDESEPYLGYKRVQLDEAIKEAHKARVEVPFYEWDPKKQEWAIRRYKEKVQFT